MRTKFFFFAMLASVAASAQTGVTITPVSATTDAVTFNVSWLNSSRTGTHNSKVWVFIDYRPVANNVPSGSWERALITGTPTATSGAPSREAGNDKGFWLQGTSGSSGTYHATVTVALSNVPAQFNWCAYVSDFPPNAEVTKGTATQGTYTLHGTPPFIIDGTYTTSALSYTGTLITSITDETNCPGIITAPEFASTYTGCGVWVELTDNTTIIPYGSVNSTVCTNRYGTGWRVPDPAEMVCICNNRSSLENPITTLWAGDTQMNQFVYWVSDRRRINLYHYDACTVHTCGSACGGRIRCVRTM